MAGAWDGVTVTYLEIADSASLSLPGAGWSWICNFYYDTGETEQTFQYLYSHAQPLQSLAAINVMAQADGVGGHEIRAIVDVDFANAADFTSSNALNADAWNTVILAYDGVDLHLWLNGTLTTASPFALGAIDPAGVARIGYAVHGGSRVWRGRIAHMAKMDYFIFDADAGHISDDLFVDPQYLVPLVWHSQIFNTNNFTDMQGNVTITESSMVYGRHSPTVYQGDSQGEGFGAPPPLPGIRRAYYVAA